MNRLRRVSDILRYDPNVEPDSTECPGLAAMAATLVSDFLGHKDKEVRLYAVLCCMELFSIVSQEPVISCVALSLFCLFLDCLWLGAELIRLID